MEFQTFSSWYSDQISSSLVLIIIWNLLQLFNRFTSKQPQSGHKNPWYLFFNSVGEKPVRKRNNQAKMTNWSLLKEKRLRQKWNKKESCIYFPDISVCKTNLLTGPWKQKWETFLFSSSPRRFVLQTRKNGQIYSTAFIFFFYFTSVSISLISLSPCRKDQFVVFTY